MNDYIWYCSYGSNIYFERFKLYIRGGTEAFVSKNFPGCSDKRLPEKDFGYEIPYELYFSRNAIAWENKGVAFISSGSDMTKKTYCRIYKITKDQFKDVVLQENALGPEDELSIDYKTLLKDGAVLIKELADKDRWYPKLLLVGSKENIPILTFTSLSDVYDSTYSLPGKKYLTTIIKGLMQSHKHLEQRDLIDYLKPLKGIAGGYSDTDLMEIVNDAL